MGFVKYVMNYSLIFLFISYFNLVMSLSFVLSLSGKAFWHLFVLLIYYYERIEEKEWRCWTGNGGQTARVSMRGCRCNSLYVTSSFCEL